MPHVINLESTWRDNMTVFKKVEKLPFIEITLKLYDVNEPTEEFEDGSKSYFATFAYSGSDVTVNDEEIGRITSPVCGGAFVNIDGHRYFLPPDDLWYAIANAIGFEMPEEKPTTFPEVEEELEEEETEEEIEEIFEPEPKILESYPIDYESTSMRRGGHIEDIPKPHIRKWPTSKQKRSITIRIMRFDSMRKHYHVSINQESNPIWDATENEFDPGKPIGWTTAWDDLEGHGLNEWELIDKEPGFQHTYILKIEAEKAVEKIVKKYFPDHEIYFDNLTGDEFKDPYAGKHEE